MLAEFDTKRKCVGTTKDGQKCSAYALLDSDYCLFHAPELEDFRLESRKNGGRGRQYVKVAGETVKLNIKNIDSVVDLVEEVIANLRTMDISVSQARALLSAAETSLKVLEYKELAERVEKLEEAVEKGRQS